MNKNIKTKGVEKEKEYTEIEVTRQARNYSTEL